jgi:DNA invertase Pin-like site-specific DNA recombinase
MIVGYARVSTEEQNIQSQLDLLKENGCEKIFSDHASGVRAEREGLKAMLDMLRTGDTVLIYKTDRLFRSLKNMIDLIEKFNAMGVHFKSLTEPEFDTTSANGKFILQIFGAVAEFERNLIRERTRLGLKNAQRRNKLLGRPKGVTARTKEKYEFALHLYATKNISVEKACKQAGIGRASFYRIDKLLKKQSCNPCKPTS